MLDISTIKTAYHALLRQLRLAGGCHDFTFLVLRNNMGLYYFGSRDFLAQISAVDVSQRSVSHSHAQRDR